MHRQNNCICVKNTQITNLRLIFGVEQATETRTTPWPLQAALQPLSESTEFAVAFVMIQHSRLDSLPGFPTLAESC